MGVGLKPGDGRGDGETEGEKGGDGDGDREREGEHSKISINDPQVSKQSEEIAKFRNMPL